MGLQINQYPIERPKVGANDFLDIDYWDGTQYRSAKIKAENVAKLEKLLDISTLDSINFENSQAEFLVKCDDGLYRNAEPSEWWHLMMQSGLISTTPNIVDHNYDSFTISTSGNWSNVYGNGLPYTEITNAFGTQTFGEPMRMMDFGFSYTQLYANPNSNFVEVDNIYMCGWTSDQYIYGNQYKVVAPNLVAMSGFQFNFLLNQLVAPNLKYIGSIQVGNQNNIIDLPNLEYANNIYAYQECAVFNLPSLRVIQNMAVYSHNQSTYNLPSLETTDGINMSSNQFVSIDFPSLVYCRNFSISDNPNLTTINFPNLRVATSNFMGFHNNALSQQAVDTILVTFANMDGQSAQYPHYFGFATILLNGGSNSAPSQVGLDAIAILQQRNCSVATN